MNIFRCWSVRNLLDLYADNRLSEGARGRVETHLKHCENCHAEAEALAPMPENLFEAVEAPPGLADAIVKKLERHSPAGQTRVTDLFQLTPAQAMALAYCALVVGTHALPDPRAQVIEPAAQEARR